MPDPSYIQPNSLDRLETAAPLTGADGKPLHRQVTVLGDPVTGAVVGVDANGALKVAVVDDAVGDVASPATETTGRQILNVLIQWRNFTAQAVGDLPIDLDGSGP